MNQTQLIDLEKLRYHVAAINHLIPTDGGIVELSKHVRGPGAYVVVADKIGLLRLCNSLLQYAVNAKPISEGSPRAEAVEIKELFEPPSGIQRLLVQLDEQTRAMALKSAAPRRTIGLMNTLVNLVRRRD